jgi:hypothetical protein
MYFGTEGTISAGLARCVAPFLLSQESKGALMEQTLHRDPEKRGLCPPFANTIATITIVRRGCLVFYCKKVLICGWLLRNNFGHCGARHCRKTL